MYRRLVGAASCGMVDSVAEIGVSGASCYIVVSNSIPVLLPLLLDSRSYGSGQNAGRQIGREWTVAATRLDKTPALAADGTASRVEAGIRASQASSSSFADGLGEAENRDACRRRWARAIMRARMRRPRSSVSRCSPV